MRKNCPFCKGKVLEVRGVGGLTFLSVRTEDAHV